MKNEEMLAVYEASLDRDISTIQLPSDWEQWFRDEGILRSYESDIDLGIYRLDLLGSEIKAVLIQNHLNGDAFAENKLKALFYFEQKLINVVNELSDLSPDFKTYSENVFKLNERIKFALIPDKNVESDITMVEGKGVVAKEKLVIRKKVSEYADTVISLGLLPTSLETYNNILKNKNYNKHELFIIQYILDHPVLKNQVIENYGHKVISVEFNWKIETPEIIFKNAKGCELKSYNIAPYLFFEKKSNIDWNEYSRYLQNKEAYLHKLLVSKSKLFNPDFLKIKK